jgi:hypothetical protein
MRTGTERETDMSSNSIRSLSTEKQHTKYCDEGNREIGRTRWIVDKLLTTYLAMSKPHPVPVVLATMAEDLAAELSDDQLLRGLSRLRKEREWVSVKSIIELSGAASEDGRPGVEVAWAMCPKDESLSAVWTPEMAEAFGVCREMLAGGDEIAARMAFKEKYLELLAAARLNHVPVKWAVSFGWDKADRVRALSEAVDKKQLTAQNAIDLLSGEQLEGFLLQLPVVERKLLNGRRDHPAVHLPPAVILTGFQRTLAMMRETKAMPNLEDAPAKFPNGNARLNVALMQSRGLDRRKA